MTLSDSHNSSSTWSEQVWLLGLPKLADFVSNVRRRTEGGPQADEGELIRLWRAAASRYRDLEALEENIADTVEIRELTAAMQPLADRVVDDPHFRKVYASLPCAFGLVELDKLIVYQQDVMIDHVARVRERLGANPTDEALFKLCLPFDHAVPEVRIGESAGRFIFHSPSTDLRFLGAELLRPDQLRDFVPNGPAAGVIALVVGFGSNYLNVVRVGKRLVLNNGYHRAYALRALGFTHAPCVIQAVSHLDELGFAGSSLIDANAELNFGAPRSPMLRDFFDAELAHHVRTPRMRRQIQVSYNASRLNVPE